MRNRWRHALLLNCLVLLSIALTSSGCRTTPSTTGVLNETANAENKQPQLLDTAQSNSETPDPPSTDLVITPSGADSMVNSAQTGQESPALNALTNGPSVDAEPTIQRPQTTGNLMSSELVEVSGLASSLRDPDLLWAINDSGNAAQLYALSRNGSSRGSWLINAINRDWEDLAAATINGEPYLFIGDIGDNQRSHDEYVIQVVREPELNARLSDQSSTAVLEPAWTIRFRYEDGAHNAEAMAVVDDQLILLTKEPIYTGQTVPTGIYTLALGPLLSTAAMAGTDTRLSIAVQAGTMQARESSFESRLAATFANIDLNHITALSIDHNRDVAWLLTYRNILRFKRQAKQSWVQALAGRGLRVYRHQLEQAEALDVSADGLVWFTTEGESAPLWVLPAHQGVADTN